MILLDFLGMNISGWLAGTGSIGVVGVIVTVLRKKGYIMSVKFWAKKLAVITHEIGEAFTESSDVFAKMDEAIKDNGHLKENTVNEIIKEGKEAVMEWKDVILVIKPKKEATVE